jgi:DNA excision repair protein ERCC-4
LPAAQQSLQGKLVLLLLAFPRVRILWASSPHATAALFADLQRGAPPPDVARAVAIGADADGGTGANAAGEELLRAIPGVGAKNAGYVMGKVGSVRELCEMSMRDVQGVLGAEPGRTCWEFMHKGER